MMSSILALARTKGRTFEEPGVTIFSPPLKANYLIVSLSTLL